MLKITFPFLLFILALTACSETQKPDAAADSSAPSTTENTEDPQEVQKPRIVFFGNSLTAGYGLQSEESFPSLIQQKVDELGLDYEVVNAGLSGETTSGGLGRIDWVLRQPIDVLVIELGANDGLRGISTDETRKNLQTMIDQVREKQPDATIVLAGMHVPPNMGEEFATEFYAIFTSLAEENNLPLIPFLLDGVAGNAELNLPDGIHPTAEGQHIVADNVWTILEPILTQS